MNKKLLKLKEILKKMESVAVAYSGGVDSTFLLKVADDVLGGNVLAVIAQSETYSSKELEEAKNIVEKLGIDHKIIMTDELKDERFSCNPKERCYFCKTELFGKLADIAKENKFNYVIDGSNVDDNSDYRPGRRAAAEIGVRSPLIEAGFTKEDIREESRKLGLSTWDKPSLACLASRIPYGTPIEVSALNRINKGEDYLRGIGFRNVRVRHHGIIARIEVGRDQMQMLIDRDVLDEISKKFKEFGYIYVTIDIDGYRTGSMNEVLTP